MPKLRPGTIIPSDKEDAEINRGIAQDPDTYELGADFFANARPASEMLPPELYKALTAKNTAQNRLKNHPAA